MQTIEVELISTSKISEDLPPLTLFPVESLRKLLTFLKDVKVEQLIEELGRRVQNGETTPLTPLLNECGYDTSQNIGAFLSSNFSKTTWMNLLKVAYSEISLFDLIPLWRGNFHQGGRIGQVILAKDELTNYFAKFSPLPEQILNLQELLFSMLHDKSLNEYLKEEGIITQLSRMIASLNIPRFDASNAEKTLKIFVKLQEIAPSIIQKYALSDWNGIYDYLSRHLLGDLNGCTHEEVRNALHFADDLKSIASVLLSPSPLPIQLLLSSSAKPKTSYTDIQKELFDCKKLFETYQDINSLGVCMTLLITPTIQTLINDKNLSHYSFIDYGENSALYERSPVNLFVTFDGCAFEGFSFKETHFLNFHFKDVYFKNCNFTNVSFAKNITFENIYLDALSAESFIKGLDDSYNKYDLKVTGIATLHIVGNLKLKTLSPKFTALLNATSYMEMPSTEEEASMTPQKQQEVQSWGATVTSGLITMINPLSKIKIVGSATYNIASGIATTILHPLETAKTMGNAGIEVVSGLAATATHTIAHPIETATKIKKNVENLASHYSSYNSKENNQADKKECEEIKPELESLKAQLTAEIERLKKDLNLISSSASKEYQELEKKILEQEKALELIQPCIAELSAKHLKTKEIHQEQDELLNSPIKHYYQTLLTGLCTVLNSIALLNNDYANLIQSSTGKANSLSNKTSKNMANSGEKRLKRLEKKLKNAIDLLLEPSELLIPILENIPEVPGIVPGAVQKLVHLSDQAKLKNTQNVFRGLTPKKLEKLSDEMARSFSFCYEQQILLLSENGAKRFAENAVQCIASALLNGLIPEDEDIVVYAFKSLRELRQYHHRVIPLINLNIPFTQEALKGKAPKTTFTADDLYRYSGIKYLEKGQWFIHHQTGLNPEKFGYINIKEERLKKQLMTPTEKPPVKWEEHKVNPLGTCNQDQVALLLEAALKDLRSDHALLKIQQEELNRRQEELNSHQSKLDERMAALDRLAQKKINGGNLIMPEIAELRSQQFSTKLKVNTQPVKVSPPASTIPSKIPVKSYSSPAVIDISPGIKNLGQSCYMNAALQVIRRIPSISDRIRTITHSDKNNAIAHALLPLLNDSKEEDLKKLRDVIFDTPVYFDTIFNGYLKQQQANNPKKQLFSTPDFDTNLFKNSLFPLYKKEAKRAYDKAKIEAEREAKKHSLPVIEPAPFKEPSYNDFKNDRTGLVERTFYLNQFKYSQQDAAEALSEILSRLSWTSVVVRDEATSIVDKDHPKKITQTFKEINYSMLPLTIEGGNAFQAIVDKYFAGSDLERTIKHVDGKTYTHWTKASKIIGTPEHIIMQLNRFPDPLSKDMTEIAFPEDNEGIFISCEVDQNTKATKKVEYEIISYINHIGETLTSGHFVSFIKNEKSGEWYFYDDDYWRQQNPRDIFNWNKKTYNTKLDAYFVVLKKKRTK